MSQLAAIQPPPAPAEPGNSRAVRHGAQSEFRLAPIRQAHADALRADYPHLDSRRTAILADRLARMEVARIWLDGQASPVRDKRGDPWPLVDRLEKWSSTAERRLDAIEAEARDRRGVGDIAGALTEIEGA